MVHVEAIDQNVRQSLRGQPRLFSEAAVDNVIPSDLADSADEHGSPVKTDPVDWIVCFVPGLRRQWWHRFVNHKHKHVFAMRPTNSGSWLLVEPWWTRMMVTVLSPADAVRFLRWGGAGDMLRVREEIPGKASQFRGWSNCAVQTAFVLGRSSRTWTPHGLYQELSREPEVLPASAEQLLVAQFRDVASQSSSNAFAFSADELSLPLKDLLFLVGRRILDAIVSPPLAELSRIAVLEARRFPALAEAFTAHWAACTISFLIERFEKADQKKEVDIDDCNASAQHFLATLCGMDHLNAALLSDTVPTHSEIDTRARAVVDVVLGAVGSGERREYSAPPMLSSLAG